MVGLKLVSAVYFALSHGNESFFDELLAEGREMVDKHLAFEMVEFVLDDTCFEPVEPFVVRLQVFIQVLYAYFGRALYRLVDSGDGQTSFVHA